MMKKIKATEIVLFVCLLLSCFVVPRYLTRQLQALTQTEKMVRGEKDYYAEWTKALIWDNDAFHRLVWSAATGGWFEQVIRVGLIGLTVFYTFRVAKRIDQRSLPPTSEDKGR